MGAYISKYKLLQTPWYSKAFFLAFSALRCTLFFSFFPILLPELHNEFVFYSWLGGAWYACFCSTVINTTLVRLLRESTPEFNLGQTAFITEGLWCELWTAVAVIVGSKPPISTGVQRYFDHSRLKTMASIWQFFVVCLWSSKRAKYLRNSIWKLEIGYLACLTQTFLSIFKIPQIVKTEMDLLLWLNCMPLPHLCSHQNLEWHCKWTQWKWTTSSHNHGVKYCCLVRTGTSSEICTRGHMTKTQCIHKGINMRNHYFCQI